MPSLESIRPEIPENERLLESIKILREISRYWYLLRPDAD